MSVLSAKAIIRFTHLKGVKPMNHLRNAESPYLRQHADNPVDWYPWSDEALALATESERPLLLSIGYAACHWCHVMAHESFEDPEIAELMNRLFVNVKVDREERPDLDRFYQTAAHLLGASGGWPLTVFCTPEGRPFAAGTYFPPRDRAHTPGLPRVLQQVASAWQDRRQEVLRTAAQVMDAMRHLRAAELHVDERQVQTSTAQGGVSTAADARNDGSMDELALTPPRPDSNDILQRALPELLAQMDSAYGGIGSSSKFPQTAVMEVLLAAIADGSQAVTAPDGGADSGAPASAQAGTAATVTTSAAGMDGAAALQLAIDAMAHGGLRDHLAGGFHRYTVDRAWSVPHFEKMLYDNALLTLLYLHTAQRLGEPGYEEVARNTADWLLDELLLPQGGFASSLDADSGAGEGAYYVWRPSDLEPLQPDLAALARKVYGITAAGNFESGATVLHRLDDRAAATPQPEPLEFLRQTMLELRRQRPAPARDDKVIVAWNGLALSALAQLGWASDKVRYVEAARHTASFLWERSWRDGEPGRRGLLHLAAPAEPGAAAGRSADVGPAQGPATDAGAGENAAVWGFLDDYAFFGNGLIDLYNATLEPIWRQRALLVGEALVDRFLIDEGEGDLPLSYTSRRPSAGQGDDEPAAETPAARTQGRLKPYRQSMTVAAKLAAAAPYDLYDSPIPSATSAALRFLLRLDPWQEAGARRGPLATAIAARLEAVALSHPQGMAALLLACRLARRGAAEVTLGDAAAMPPVATDGNGGDTLGSWHRRLGRLYLPDVVLSVASESDSAIATTTAAGPQTSAAPWATVCRSERCSLPVHDWKALLALLPEVGTRR